MELFAVIFSIIALVMAVMSMTTMVLDSVQRTSILNKLTFDQKAYEESTRTLGLAHNNLVEALKDMEVRLETNDLQIKSLTLGSQAPKRGF